MLPLEILGSTKLFHLGKLNPGLNTQENGSGGMG